MENTGRIRRPLVPAARRIVFGRTDQSNHEELWYISQVDQAHVLMLAERGIVSRERAGRLLAAIGRLRDTAFAPLDQREATRGVFLLYEDYLIETEGAAVGGMLQTARSRNDLSATVLNLRLRRPYLRLLEQGLRLHAILLCRSRDYANVIMPVYTHGQAGMPSTYGHYLAGTAAALTRNLELLAAASRYLQCCPLGAGAAAGTSFPIDTKRTADLLGFSRGPLNSLDAVASRDTVLQLLACASIYSVNLSRLASDLLQWTTAEFDFLRLPDELVGSSSAMPQKRNPFLLEHVLGRTSLQLGAFVQSAAAMRGAPFTNSIAVGTEATKPIWDALQSLTEVIQITCQIVAHAKPHCEAMLRRTLGGITTATEFANRLVIKGDLDFRSAHHIVGAAIAAALENNCHVLDALAEACTQQGVPVSADDLSPEAVVESLEFGGGPGRRSLAFCLEHLRRTWQRRLRRTRSLRKLWQNAASRLQEAVDEFPGCSHAVSEFLKDGPELKHNLADCCCTNDLRNQATSKDPHSECGSHAWRNKIEEKA